jgi:hypothetical protein
VPLANYADDPCLRIVKAETSIALHLNMHATAVTMDGPKIAAVTAQDVATGEEWRFAAPLFADCTGDGCVGFLAGADFRMGRESRSETKESMAPEKADRLMMGATLYWEAAKGERPTPFPACEWAISNRQGNATHGGWTWECGFGRDTVTDAEIIRDYELRAIYGHWSAMKQDPAYANWSLASLAYVAAKRESRRLLGDVVLTENDIRNQVAYPDACVVTTWSIDLHVPTNAKEFPDGAFRSKAIQPKIKPYPIPYRCLYSRNVGNLFMAGRDISVTHVALGTVRVMATTGMMGEVVGIAGTLCKRHACAPRDVFASHLTEFQALLQQGVPQASSANVGAEPKAGTP